MKYGRLPMRRLMAPLLVMPVLVTSCGGGAIAPMPVSSPAVVDAPTPVPVRIVRRTMLPSRVESTSWLVRTTTRIRVDGVREEQRLDTQGRVSWSLDREASGALRASGQVDSFVVRPSLDSAIADRGIPSALLLLDGTLDSSTWRVATRPPQANECDRIESSAAALARELLVRVPDGVQAGERWTDSTVSLVCRSGVPITVYTTIRSRLERLTDDMLIVRRNVTTALEGKGGSAFRALEVAGKGSGEQRVEINALRGNLERLEGTSTLTLQVSERTPSAPVRSQQVVQRVELKAERVVR